MADVKIHPMNPQTIKVACSNCNLRELCMPMGLSMEEIDRLDNVVASRRKIKRGTSLFRNGEKFSSLYAIRTGFFKTCVASEDGRDQVTGFQMAGEIIGLDGIVNDHHTCDAVALEDAEVCVMPFDRIEDLSREIAERIVRDLGKPLRPAAVIAVPELPRTRSGKIMRRVARAAFLGRDPGDLSALENAGAVDAIGSLRGA